MYLKDLCPTVPFTILLLALLLPFAGKYFSSINVVIVKRWYNFDVNVDNKQL